MLDIPVLNQQSGVYLNAFPTGKQRKPTSKQHMSRGKLAVILKSTGADPRTLDIKGAPSKGIQCAFNKLL